MPFPALIKSKYLRSLFNSWTVYWPYIENTCNKVPQVEPPDLSHPWNHHCCLATNHHPTNNQLCTQTILYDVTKYMIKVFIRMWHGSLRTESGSAETCLWVSIGRHPFPGKYFLHLHTGLQVQWWLMLSTVVLNKPIVKHYKCYSIVTYQVQEDGPPQVLPTSLWSQSQSLSSHSTRP